MNEDQINLVLYHNLNDRRDFYKGTYASNELVGKKLRVDKLGGTTCFSFIVNTLQRYESNKMGHWLSIMVKIDGKKINLKFVDSFKMPYGYYGDQISNYINHYRLLAMENNVHFTLEEVPFSMQAANSKSCGAYSVFSILGLKNCKSSTLYKIFSGFDTKNKNKNDKFVEDFVVRKWPNRFCSDILTRSNKVPFCPQKTFNRPGCLLICKCGKDCCTKLRSEHYKRSNLKFLFSM